MVYDIVVVGAGLAGSSLASVLASLGWQVLLLEQGQYPRHKVCGEFLSPESQASLRALGLEQAVMALGPSHMRDALFVGRGGSRLQVALPGTAFGVSRYALDAALAAAAVRAGAELRTGVTVTDIVPEAAGFEVSVRLARTSNPPAPLDAVLGTAPSDSPHETTAIQARAVVVACGRHPVRALRAEAAARGTRRTWVGVKGHYVGVEMPSQVEIYLFDAGYVGLAPIEHGRVNLAALMTREAFGQQRGSVAQILGATARQHPALARRLEGGTLLPESALAVAPVDTDAPGVPWHTTARIGDAAIMIPPLCGDGQAMALRSAELCALSADEFLRGSRSLRGWEDAYRTAWHREFDRPVRVGRSLQRLLGIRGVGDAMLRVGVVLPALATRLVHATRGKLRPLLD